MLTWPVSNPPRQDHGVEQAARPGGPVGPPRRAFTPTRARGSYALQPSERSTPESFPRGDPSAPA
jgi:hypothetical protein